MSTKYPLNGRTATIYDLITEFSETSDWPSGLSTDASREGFSPTDEQPFKSLILNNLQEKDPNSYEVVWFNDNIYSDTLYDYINKQYKIVQYNDTSLSHTGQTLEINVSCFNVNNIETNGIRYKFIVGNKKKAPVDLGIFELNQFYYNYKCDNGEARVIYSLQKILDIIVYDTSINNYLFGVNDTDKISTDSDSPSLFDHNSSVFTIYGFPEQYDLIINDNGKYIVNPLSYDTLGSYYWTRQNVLYDNYTTRDMIVQLNGDFPNVADTSVLPAAINILFPFPTDRDNSDYMTYYAQDKAWQLYYYTLMFLYTQRHFVSYITSCDFIRVSDMIYQRNQPILRCDISLLQFITNITILNAVHKPRTALMPGVLTGSVQLEFELTLEITYRNIDKPTDTIVSLIVDINHIALVASVENDEQSYKYEFYTLVLPDAKDENSQVCPVEFNNGDITGVTPKYYSYGEKYFSKIEDYQGLKNILWPFNDKNKLQLSKDNFDLVKEQTYRYVGSLSPSYIDSYNKYCYPLDNTGNIQYDDDGQSFYWGDPASSNAKTFFGKLRIHNSYKKPTIPSKKYTQEENPELNNSSYYFDVSIVRIKNYFYIQEYEATTDPDKPDDATLQIFYTPPYYYDSTNNYDIPNTSIGSVKIKGDWFGRISDDQNTKAVVDELFDNISGDNKYFYVPRNTTTSDISNRFNDLYLLIKTNTGSKKVFLSGYEDLESESTQYYNTASGNDIVVYYLNSPNAGSWNIVNNEQYTITTHEFSNKLKYFKLSLNDTGDFFANITHIRIKITSLSNNYYYFRISQYTNTGIYLNIYYLRELTDTPTNSVYNAIQFMVYDKLDQDVTNIKYESLANCYTEEDTTGPYTDVYYKISDPEELNLYIKLTSLTETTTTGETTSQYEYNFAEINGYAIVEYNESSNRNHMETDSDNIFTLSMQFLDPTDYTNYSIFLGINYIHDIHVTNGKLYDAPFMYYSNIDATTNRYICSFSDYTLHIEYTGNVSGINTAHIEITNAFNRDQQAVYDISLDDNRHAACHINSIGAHYPINYTSIIITFKPLQQTT